MNNRVTIKDVAKKANVSLSTVSFVLNNTDGQTISEETKKEYTTQLKHWGITPTLSPAA